MKRLLLLLVPLCVLVVLSSCNPGKTSDDQEVENDTEVNNNNETEEVESNEENEANDEKKAILTDLGLYIGQADPHTIEIETNEGSKAFQFDSSMSSDIEALQKDDEVQFTYYVNEHDQNVLQAIEKLNSSDANNDEKQLIEATGIYNGQADPHTIEIETDDGPQAFQLSMKARSEVDKLTVGKSVSFTYYEKGPQLVIESIQHNE